MASLPRTACLFCRIVRGEIPSARVLETDHALAFLDINPVNRGHVLLVPKAHHATLAELHDDLAAETAARPQARPAIREATGADGPEPRGQQRPRSPARRSTTATGTSSPGSRTTPSAGPGRTSATTRASWSGCGRRSSRH